MAKPDCENDANYGQARKLDVLEDIHARYACELA